ncbi:MAG TPA: nitroreductase family deazaflavin-dependent oxidoreductase, partial [Dehalococcoidia bacterium]|nr:nitroreductase family deazaflavin-dependent oxidoreductase [Dehalococcoidia bacterium]
MSENAPLRPGTPGWQQEHVRRYQATDGEDGYIWNNAPILLLTTKGRKSGKDYTTPLIFGEDNGRYLIVASRGGAPAHPQWYLNLVANPEVGLQVKGDKFKARARTADDAEKPALWKTMTAIWPAY